MRTLVNWPVSALWRGAGAAVGVLGRTAAVVVGVALVSAGGASTMTVVGALLGVPMILLGATLVARALRRR